MTKTNSASRCALALAASLACGGAWSQSVPVPPSVAASAAERAQRETDRTMYWIRVLADKPAPAKAAPAPKPVAAAPAPQPKPAPERVKVAAAARTTADTANATPLAVVTPEPATPAPAPALAPSTSTPDPTALSSGSAERAAAAVGTTAALAAPTATPPAIDLPATEPEPAAEDDDPGLIMTKSVQPDFPPYAIRRLRKGSVEVKFEVDPNGVVVDTSVVKTSHASLNASAMEAVKQWRFKPTPKSHTALVELAFNIDN